MVSTFLRDPQAQSSALTVLGMPQRGPSGLLKCVETLDSASNWTEFLSSLYCVTYIMCPGHPYV